MAVPQPSGIDPAVLSVLQSGPYAGLNLAPAAMPPKRVTIRKNPHECVGWLKTFVCEAEEIIEDIVQDIEHLLGIGHAHSGNGTSLRMTMPPNGLQSLLFEFEADPAEEPGAVHVFDVIQTDAASGRHGGLRLAWVTTP